MKAWLSGQNMMFYILSALTVAGIIVQAVTNHVYKRLIKASEHVEQTDIKAKFEDGILKIFVPKKEAKPVVEEKKYITIEG